MTRKTRAPRHLHQSCCANVTHALDNHPSSCARSKHQMRRGSTPKRLLELLWARASATKQGTGARKCGSRACHTRKRLWFSK